MAVQYADARLNDDNVKAVLFLIAGVSLFSIQDVIIKFFSADLPLMQVMFMRGLVAMLPICWLVWRESRGRGLKSSRKGLLILRGLIGACCYTSFYMALAVLTLADTVTLYYTNPLLITALAIPFLAEAVGFRRWIAIAVGFIGVLVVVRPDGGSFDPAMILGIASAFFYAGQSLLSRVLGKTESGATMAFYSMAAFIGFSAVAGLVFGSGAFDQVDHGSARFLLRAWGWPTVEQFGLIVMIGLIAGLGFYWLAQAYRVGSASIVAPFEYTSLPFAVFWGWLFWQNIPDMDTILGSLLIVGSGLYIVHREMSVGRRIVFRKGLRSRL